MNETKGKAGNIVLEYIAALDTGQYDQASNLIDDNVKIIGPAGENFGKPKDFTNMLKRYSGRYSILKMFVDDEDVCLLYDYKMPNKTVYMSSWYMVKGGKIVFIRTIFDPSSFD
jgi:hypothetical protein